MQPLDTATKLMRAIIFRKYGDPRKVMALVNDLEKPQPNKNEVLVKVACCSINAADNYMVRANYFIIRLVLGLFQPAKKNRVLGMDVAGTIETIGEGVKGFQLGDAVVADMRKSLGGGFAEYAVIHTANLVKKPVEVTFEEAATVPIAGQAAMMGIILCSINPGDKILINGASGGVGSFAVQLAKAQGAQVTALCSTEKVDAVRDWGADEIIDYKKTSIKSLKSNEYNAVFDTASFGNPRDYQETLKENGKYVLVGGDFYNMLRLKLFGWNYGRKSQQFMSLSQEVDVTKNIKTVLDLFVQGQIKPAIQKVISLGEIPEAIHSLEERKVIGKIIVNVSNEVSNPA